MEETMLKGETNSDPEAATAPQTGSLPSNWRRVVAQTTVCGRMSRQAGQQQQGGDTKLI